MALKITGLRADEDENKISQSRLDMIQRDNLPNDKEENFDDDETVVVDPDEVGEHEARRPIKKDSPIEEELEDDAVEGSAAHDDEDDDVLTETDKALAAARLAQIELLTERQKNLDARAVQIKSAYQAATAEIDVIQRDLAALQNQRAQNIAALRSAADAAQAAQVQANIATIDNLERQATRRLEQNVATQNAANAQWGQAVELFQAIEAKKAEISTGDGFANDYARSWARKNPAYKPNDANDAYSNYIRSQGQKLVDRGFDPDKGAFYTELTRIAKIKFPEAYANRAQTGRSSASASASAPARKKPPTLAASRGTGGAGKPSGSKGGVPMFKGVADIASKLGVTDKGALARIQANAERARKAEANRKPK